MNIGTPKVSRMKVSKLNSLMPQNLMRWAKTLQVPSVFTRHAIMGLPRSGSNAIRSSVVRRVK